MPGLPDEIAFLIRHGVSMARLQRIAARAARIGVDPASEAIASGLVGETAFYRALAAELGLPFCDDELSLRAGGDLNAILGQGIAPVAMPGSGIRLVLAPTGPALRRMLAGGPHLRNDIVVTTPSLFAAALRRANSRVLASRIAGLGLERQSARTGISRGQYVTAGCCIGPTSFFGTLAPLETILLMMLLAGPFFLAVIFLRLAAVFEPPPVEAWRRIPWQVDDGRLPVYTVAVPLFREEKVLPKLIKALAALDYPAAKLDIRLLVEEHDHGLRQALARCDLPPNVAVMVVPRGRPQTKPRALNLALLEARGEIFTIYDAEDVPDPLQLRLAAAQFLRSPKDLACLQARLVIDNGGDGWLQSLFALEYAGLFDVLNPGLLRLRLPIMLGGTSNHFRTSALREVGGWDAWNVTEDADIGLRLLRAGYRMDDLPSRTLEEAPDSFSSWLKQRIRWNKGYVQTLISHLRDPLALLREAGRGPTCAFLALALGGMVSSLLYPAFAVAVAAAALDGSLFAAGKSFGDVATVMAGAVTLSGSLALLAAPTLGAVRRRAFGLLKYLPLLPVYYALVSVASWLALVEYARAPFRWNKTEHGMARTSRYSGTP
ncbi:glycosyltransferase family 2 protein [Bosea caraganae]|uniref:glycosyltransferase family 2 protein n=1 Tax=Bosea caraganae TaxID=2763117 RepID=UPI0015F0EC4B|nr:glycosyltransferase family 2 protein [Bosea caraganae]